MPKPFTLFTCMFLALACLSMIQIHGCCLEFKVSQPDIRFCMLPILCFGAREGWFLVILLNVMQMPVPVLKEQIASVTGVLSEQQRLICRGRVLKDDQLLSAYRILFINFSLWVERFFLSKAQYFPKFCKIWCLMDFS